MNSPSDSATEVVTGNTYDKYGSTNPIARRLMRGFMTALDHLLPATPPSTVLEIGTGEGEVAQRLRHRYPDASLAGLDLPDPVLADHWRRRGLPGAFGDATSLPIRSRSVDLVLAIEVLEHVADPAAALREIARIAERHVVLSVPREPMWRALNLARGAYIRDLGNTPGHVQHWSSRRFVEIVARHFDVVTVERPVPWTLVAARVRS